MSKLPIDRIMQSQGFGTRKYCHELIADGEVRIAGATVTDSHSGIETNDLEFSVFGKPHRYREHVYIALNKPRRLRMFAQAQPSPRHTQPAARTIRPARCAAGGPPRPRHHRCLLLMSELVAQLLGGVKLHDEPAPLAAITCRMLGTRQLEIVLEQGKYHQVKRMLA